MAGTVGAQVSSTSKGSQKNTNCPESTEQPGESLGMQVRTALTLSFHPKREATETVCVGGTYSLPSYQKSKEGLSCR